MLLALVGPAAERALGAWRFLALTVAAIALQVGVRRLTGIDANGACVFLWAYAPVFWWSRRQAPANGPSPAAAGPPAGPLLLVMWGVIPLVMTGLLTAQGHGPLTAFLGGNAFHLSATVAGFAAVVVWNRLIRLRAG